MVEKQTESIQESNLDFMFFTIVLASTLFTYQYFVYSSCLEPIHNTSLTIVTLSGSYYRELVCYTTSESLPLSA